MKMLPLKNDDFGATRFLSPPPGNPGAAPVVRFCDFLVRFPCISAAFWLTYCEQ